MDGRLVSASTRPARSGSRLVRLANAAAVMQDARATGRARTQATQCFEAIIRELATDDLHVVPDAAFFEAVNVTARAFRDGCMRLSHRLAPFDGPPSAFHREMQLGVAALGWHHWADASVLRTPSGDVWPETPTSDSDALRWSTIHGFKGLQALAVAVAIPAPLSGRTGERAGVTLWHRNQVGEERRVLYVGASRASCRTTCHLGGGSESVRDLHPVLAARWRGVCGAGRIINGCGNLSVFSTIYSIYCCLTRSRLEPRSRLAS